MNKNKKMSMNISILNNEDNKKIFLEDFPYSYRENIDGFASSLLNKQSGKVMVIGFSNVGKTFLIQQLINNIDSYIEKTEDLKEMLFIRMNQLDLNKINVIEGGIEFIIENITEKFNLQDRELCVVTESPDVASIIGYTFPEVKLILEVSIPTFLELKKSEDAGKSKFWSSWEFVDANFIKLNKKDLVDLMSVSLLPQSKKITFRRREISLFITHILNKFEEILDEEEKSIIPPGLWAVAFGRVIGTLTFSSDPQLINREGKIVYGRVMSKVSEEVKELFEGFLKKLSSSTRVSASDIFEQLGMNVFKSGDRITFSDEEIDFDEIFGGKSPKKMKEKSKKSKKIEFRDFNTLKKRLNQTVIGQEEAVSSLVDGLVVPMAGINDTNKPLRTILFAGKSGVGKTSLALSLAKELATIELPVIRLDMSEYGHDHESSKLFGSAPGYVGHENGGVLTNAVKESPQSIILLDEVEKADPKIWDSFLQVFDAGRMTDSSGETVDFTQTIIILTSNLGVKELSKNSAGFMGVKDEKETNLQNKKTITAAIEKFFKPEFINRLDEIIFFNELREDDIKTIIKKEIEKVKERIGRQDITLNSPSEVVINKIYEMSDTDKYGAREIQRVILNNIVSPIAKSIIKNNGSKEISIEYSLGDFLVK